MLISLYVHVGKYKFAKIIQAPVGNVTEPIAFGDVVVILVPLI